MHRKPSNKRCEEIKRLAVDTLIYCNIKSFPISAEKMAKSMCIDIVDYSSFDSKLFEKIIDNNEDGFLVYNKCQAKIFYNKEINLGRRNFTLLHEIGHYILQHDKDGEIEEAEANIFAKYILAPHPVIHFLIENFDFNLDEMSIMQKFGVSKEAADNIIIYYKKWESQFNYQYNKYEQKLLNYITMQ